MSEGDGGDRSDAASKASGPTNLQLRVISAVVLAAAVLGVTYLGGLAFRILAAGIAAAVFYEWSAMSRTSANGGFQLALGILLGLLLLALILAAPASVVLVGTAIGAAGALAAGLLLGHGRSGAVGLAYAALSGLSLALLRGDDRAGLLAILFLFAVVWATDIMAYFTGRAVGGPKLAPSISPGKTWSGAVGGAVAGIAAGLLFAAVSGQPSSLWLALVALLLTVVSQAGDLAESAAKRRYGVKDSGSIIPGHGGVMDRVDGLVAAAFALYLVGLAAAGPDNPAHSLFPA